MKIIGINGSPRKDGNTFTSLTIAGNLLQDAGIDFEIVHVDSDTKGCMACGGCVRAKNEKCVIDTDKVNATVQKVKNADGIIIASPVYFAGVAGSMKSFLDRLFYVSHANGGLFRHKVGQTLVSVRRSGGISTFDTLNHYVLYAEMIVPSSNYWNVIHGAGKAEVLKDDEGMQIVDVMTKNMIWVLNMIEATKDTVTPPSRQDKKYMNFIRDDK